MHSPEPGQPAALDWHNHDCSACGCAYRYLRPGRAGQRTPLGAQACPQCGFVPPDVRAGPERGRELVVALFGATVAAMGLGIATAGRMTPVGVAYLIACAAAVAVMFHLTLASMDPNYFRARNLRSALRHVAAGRAQVLRVGRAWGHETPPNASGTGLVLYLSLAVTVVVTALAPVAIAGAKGCRGNFDAPKVVGPDCLAQVAPPTTRSPA